MDIKHTYPEPHPQTAGRVIDNEAVLILSDISEINVLNGVGSRVFELSTGEHSVAGIITAITDEYDVTTEQATSDVVSFLQELSAQNVLVLKTRS